nr:hypothetical protein [Tanacetum cinerariifolium]
HAYGRGQSALRTAPQCQPRLWTPVARPGFPAPAGRRCGRRGSPRHHRARWAFAAPLHLPSRLCSCSVALAFRPRIQHVLPLRNKSALRAAALGIGEVKGAGRIYRDAVRLIQALACYHRYRAVGANFFDAVVVGVGHVHAAIGGHGHPARLVKAAGQRRNVPGRADFFDDARRRAAACIDHIHRAIECHGHARRLSRGATSACPAAAKRYAGAGMVWLGMLANCATSFPGELGKSARLSKVGSVSASKTALIHRARVGKAKASNILR